MTPKWTRYYQAAAVALLNALIVLVLLNLAALPILTLIEKRGSDPMTSQYGERLRPAYPGWDQQALREMLRETWGREYTYQPFTYFKEGAFKGKYVNVDQHGFRMTKDQGPWPPERSHDFVIFLFGGSTSFAYGLPDDQTVASYLQELLSSAGTQRRPRVYNFAQGYYYSSQEQIQYERLLASGFVPDVAVFVDGLNEYYRPDDNPQFSDRVRRLFDTQQNTKGPLAAVNPEATSD